MYNPLRMVLDNVLKLATLTAPSAGTLVPDNLKTSKRTERWQSSTATTTLIATFENPVEIDTVVLTHTNCSGETVSRLQLKLGGATVHPGAIELLDIADVPEPYVSFHLPNPILCDRIELYLSNPSAGSNSASAMIVGKAWTPEVSASLGMQGGMNSFNTETRDDAGNLRTLRRFQRKRIHLQFDALTTGESDELFLHQLNDEENSPVFVSVYPESDNKLKEQLYSIYGKVDRELLTTTYYNAARAMFVINEI